MKRDRQGSQRPTYREPSEEETPWIVDFHDRRYESRRLFAECLGAFFLVLATVGPIAVGAAFPGSISSSAQSVVPGLVIIAAIYSLGGVSGSHLNPAVTFSYALRGNFPWIRVPGYVAAQISGAIAAVALVRLCVGTAGHLGVPGPGANVSTGVCFLLEVLLTFGLVTVTLGTASGQNNVGPNAALARGAYVAAAGLWASPLSGASMNPARSLASSLLEADWSNTWIYVIGPLLGGALAVGGAWILRGKPSLNADITAKGSDEQSDNRE